MKKDLEKKIHKPTGVYTELEVAEMLNKSIASLRSDACRRKGCPRIKLGKRIFYSIETFNEWIKAHETNYTK